MERAVVLAAWLALAGAVLAGVALPAARSPQAAAQVGTSPATPAGRDVPAGAECRVAPRSLASFAALATPAVGLSDPAPVAPRGTPLPPGEPLDAATLAAVAATAREVIACRNAGEPLRSLALYSDAFLREYFGAPGLFTPEGYAALATPRPIDPALQAALVAVRDGRRLADGRVGATVVVDDPVDAASGAPSPSADFLIFVEQDGRWLVDGVIEGVGTGGTPEP